YEALGVAVYVLLAGWFVAVVVLFLRRQWLTWSLRLAGWTLLLPGVAAAADLFINTYAGGAVGAWINVWLQDQLTPWGGGLARGGCLLLAVVLALDSVLFPLLRGMWFCPGGWLRRLSAVVPESPSAASAPIRRPADTRPGKNGHAVPPAENDAAAI